MTTHISYKCARRLKEFCPELPEPMADNTGHGRWWYERDNPNLYVFKDDGHISYPAYQLHDILSKAFCEAFVKNLSDKEWPVTKDCPEQISKMAREVYYVGGLPAVEAELLKMMEAK